jgi:hypothetical protein
MIYRNVLLLILIRAEIEFVDYSRLLFFPKEITETSTFTTPLLIMLIFSAAALDKSIILPRICGPSSVILTKTDRPFDKFVTFAIVPKGNVLCAAVSLV